MKKIIVILTVLSLFFPAYTFAEDFLGAPTPQGKEIKRTAARLEMTTELSHDAVLDFFKNALEKAPDIKYRDWKDATYIEDDGRKKWHSITISKDQTPTSILIVKDNFTWIIGTLVLRYIAVFVVLMVLFVGMLVSGKIISSSVKKAQAKA